MKNWILKVWHNLEEHLNKPWFPWVVGFVFFIDHFILFVPLDALLVTSVLAAPKRWIALFVGAATGFALGAVLFAHLIQLYGLSIVERLTPGVTHTAVWMQSELWMHHYGIVAVGVFSMIPLTMHPLVAIAALNHIPLLLIGLSLFVTRFLKYGLLAWISVYAPVHLHRFKFFRKMSERATKRSLSK